MSAGTAQALLRTASTPVARILDKALAGTSALNLVSIEEGETLLRAQGSDVHAIVAVADSLRSRRVGDNVTFVTNRNINFTNVCVKRCGFCAFSRTGIDSEGYFLPTSEIIRRAKEAHSLGATEVCLQAGLPPNLDPGFYENICRQVKSHIPDIHIHAFSPEEVLYGATRARASINDYLLRLKDAGLNTLPGTSAEILDDSVRDTIAKGRISTDKWVEIITTAHGVGLRTTATMMFGHCESPMHISAHLALIREIHSRTNGFTEFVPLSFVASDAPMYKQKTVPSLRGGPTGREVVLAHAVSRIMLDGYIPNIQVSWVKEGLRMAQYLLTAGCNDLGGTLMNESISTSAGAGYGQLVTPQQFMAIINDAGRIPVERYTDYRIRRVFDSDVGCESLEHTLNSLDATDAEERLGSFQQLIKSSQHRYRDVFGRRRPHTTDASTDPNTRHQCRQHHTLCARQRNGANRSIARQMHTQPKKDVGTDQWMSLERAREVFTELSQHTDTCEVLILSGEVHPKSVRRREWVLHIEDLCRVALDFGLLPHTNCGPLSFNEMRALSRVNVSMGLMLEQVAHRILKVHRFAPSKVTSVRIHQLEQAGELQIPFTTGILLGIGETDLERVDTLQCIAELHNRYGHIGECILQPYSPGNRQADTHTPGFALEDLPHMVRLAKDILPPDVAIQVPPNLVNSPSVLLDCLEAGASDLGGVSPIDEVNPDYAFPAPMMLETFLDRNGYQLRPRLPLHPKQYHLVTEPSVYSLLQTWVTRYAQQSISTSSDNRESVTAQ